MYIGFLCYARTKKDGTKEMRSLRLPFMNDLIIHLSTVLDDSIYEIFIIK